MYSYPFHYPAVYPIPSYPGYLTAYPIPRTYPPVDTKIFAGSVKSFRLLMEQGSVLLDRLGDQVFSKKLMSAAQQGKNAEVDQMIKSIGLKVPVITKFTPSGVSFNLITNPTQQNPANCCTLTVAMKWGQ